ncbi:hypothetical protein M2322_003089 [Rhodoblastus acidophilus]|uniref:RyR domain-containing protein n=1 Tax=Rhodoblastus acidophilus TaxID=1074 RepID=UPI00222512B0|nr:RyR domain-containing protein [Rhodoblastus acidophilus]MCW2317530.1 hypothetical protein [Rhodoblastus acidophilus]
MRLLALLTRLALKFSTLVGENRALLQFVLGALALALGFWGWSIKEPVHDWSGWLNNFFRTLQLITLHFPTEFNGDIPWPLQVARLLVPLIAVSATFHILLGGVTRPLRLALLPHMRDHVVLIGEAQLAQAALIRLAEGERQTVALAQAFDAARRDTLEGLGLTVLEADPKQPATFKALNLQQAGALFVAGADDLENINLALLAVRALDKRPSDQPPLALAVKIDREDLACELAAALDGIARRHGVRYHRLCPDRDGLRIELARFAPVFTKPDRAVASHVLILGLQGRWEQAFGQILVASQDHPARRPNITLALSAGERAAFETWRAARPDLPLIADVRCLDFPSPDDEAGKIVAACGAPHLAVVLLDGADAIAAALALRRSSAFAAAATPVLVRQSREDFLLSALRDTETSDRNHKNLVAFSGPVRFESVARVLDRAGDESAMALHAHYLEGGARLRPGSTAALAAWDDLPENLREANRASADHMAILFASEGLTLADAAGLERVVNDSLALDRLARVEHRRWMADRIERGWRFGETRDNARLIHPSLKPYETLSDTEQEKDRRTVRVLAKLAAEPPLAGRSNRNG